MMIETCNDQGAFAAGIFLGATVGTGLVVLTIDNIFTARGRAQRRYNKRKHKLMAAYMDAGLEEHAAEKEAITRLREEAQKVINAR
jgi:hypothetical protein